LPKVVGFDGIKDITLFIDNNDDFIFDTVSVELKKQIEKLITIIDKLVVNKTSLPDDQKHVLHPCVSYRKLITNNK